MSDLARRLAERDQHDGSLSLFYARDPRRGWEWSASINVLPVRRGTPKHVRLRIGYGPTPEAAMRALDRLL